MSRLINAAETIAQLPTMRWTVERYHQMINGGFLNEYDRVELLFGKLVSISPVGINHRRTVNKIMRRLTEEFPESSHYIDVQNPVTLTDDSEPEPDLYVALGPSKRYAQRHPQASDLLLVIEVSDSTLQYDRTAKQLSYALSAVSEYWIINLYEKQVERYTDPQPAEGTYADLQVFKRGDTIDSLHLGRFSVDELLVD